ncbi:MAG: SLAC1 anion channel family protein [Marivibrio sp.]|uniref:SLAC1 anion channel family protein n=1 Tax=Marivibrio sp. TaxID=2039719 RepID=UPI0032EC0705
MSDDAPDTGPETGARKASDLEKDAVETSPAKRRPAKKAAAKKTAAKKRPASAAPEASSPHAPDARAAARAGRALRNPSTRHFPVQMFASVLGVAGLGLAWREAGQVFGFTLAVGELFLGFAAGFYIAVLALYGLKAARHPDAMAEDFTHPVRGCYFSAAGMGLLLLSAAAAPHSLWLAEALWIFGAPVNFAITLAIVSGWMTREFHMRHATPVWFLPIAGNLLAAIAGAPLGYVEIGWMAFAIGVVFWLALQVVIFYRLLFHEPIEQPLRPTIVIMLAPPALAYIAYQVLAGGPVFGALGGFGTMFYGLTLFIAALLAVQVPMLMRLPFALSNWSYTFPISALAAAGAIYAGRHESWAADGLAIVTLAGATLITIWVAATTGRALLAGALFRSPQPGGERQD